MLCQLHTSEKDCTEWKGMTGSCEGMDAVSHKEEAVQVCDDTIAPCWPAGAVFTVGY